MFQAWSASKTAARSSPKSERRSRRRQKVKFHTVAVVRLKSENLADPHGRKRPGRYGRNLCPFLFQECKRKGRFFGV